MSRSDADWVAWTREHRVSYELAPLLETRGGDKVQSGFTLSLYAAAPMDKAAGAERQEAGRKLWDELRPSPRSRSRSRSGRRASELDPPRTALLRPGERVQARGRADLAHLPARANPRRSRPRTAIALASLEKRLAALGLKRGRWYAGRPAHARRGGAPASPHLSLRAQHLVVVAAGRLHEPQACAGCRVTATRSSSANGNVSLPVERRVDLHVARRAQAHLDPRLVRDHQRPVRQHVRADRREHDRRQRRVQDRAAGREVVGGRAGRARRR